MCVHNTRSRTNQYSLLQNDQGIFHVELFDISKIASKCLNSHSALYGIRLAENRVSWLAYSIQMKINRKVVLNSYTYG
jgi:hypothetical protein